MASAAAVPDGIVGHLRPEDLAAADDGGIQLPPQGADIVQPQTLSCEFPLKILRLPGSYATILTA